MRAEVSAPVAVPTGADTSARPAAPVDRAVDAGAALELVLALQARIRLDQLDSSETLDELFQGVSSRRNQVLIDLGREFGLSGAEGVQRQSIGELVKTLREQGASYRFPGAYLREALAAGLTPGERATRRRDRAPGRDVGARPRTHRARARAGRARHASRPVGARRRARPPAGAGAGAARPRRRADRRATSAIALAAGLSRPRRHRRRSPDAALETALAPALGRPAVEGEPLERAGPGDALGSRSSTPNLARRAAQEVAPRFDARRHVRFASAWASARWDLVAAYHDAIAAASRGRRWPRECDRLAAHAARRPVASTAALPRRPGRGRGTRMSRRRWPARDRGTRRRHAPPVASCRLRRVASCRRAGWRRAGCAGWRRGCAGCRRRVASCRLRRGTSRRPRHLRRPRAPWSALPLAGTRPTIEIAADGIPVVGVADDPARPRDLILGLAAGAPDAPVSAQEDAGPRWSRRSATRSRARPTCAARSRSSPARRPARSPPSSSRACCAAARRSSSPPRPTRPARRRLYRELYRTAAGPGAELHVVPANLASFADIDALAAWLRRARRRPSRPRRPARSTRCARRSWRRSPRSRRPATLDRRRRRLRDRAAAAAARRRAARRGRAGAEARAADRRCCRCRPTTARSAATAPYGETKAALEVLLARWRSEQSRGARDVRIVAPRIGWVRGTGLMGRATTRSPPLVEERLGVRTFSAAEMGWLLARGCSPACASAPLRRSIDLAAASRASPTCAARSRRSPPSCASARARAPRRAPARARARAAPPPTPVVDALPGARHRRRARAASRTTRPTHALDPADLVVIVGTGELGPGGTGRSRFALELGEPTRPASSPSWRGCAASCASSATATAAAGSTPRRGDEVPEEQLAARYATRSRARVGVRPLEADGDVDAGGLAVLAPVTLAARARASRSTTRRRRARSRRRRAADVRRDGERWHVTLRAGRADPRAAHVAAHAAASRASSRRASTSRASASPATCSPAPTGWRSSTSPARSRRSPTPGSTPEELLGEVHPALVANTQGAGMGGMASLRRLLLDHLLDGERQTDRLQESLGNVVAAHAVQAFVGSYGPMVHPVARLRDRRDLARGGATTRSAPARRWPSSPAASTTSRPRASLGFGDMGATATSDELDAHGLAPHEASRANDVRRARLRRGPGRRRAARRPRRRRARARAAGARRARLRGELRRRHPRARSRPPGMGVLARARRLPLARALARLGLDADDIAVVSKHDTSTEMNDPNEADLHERIQAALGRTPGNPLLVVSQKTVTGHAKGGAAAWQVDGRPADARDAASCPATATSSASTRSCATARCLTLGDRPIRLAASRSAPRSSRASASATSRRCSRSPTPTRSSPRVPEDAARGLPAPRRPPPRRGRPAAASRTRLGRPAPVRRTTAARRRGAEAATREAEAALLTTACARLTAASTAA